MVSWAVSSCRSCSRCAFCNLQQDSTDLQLLERITLENSLKSRLSCTLRQMGSSTPCLFRLARSGNRKQITEGNTRDSQCSICCTVRDQVPGLPFHGNQASLHIFDRFLNWDWFFDRVTAQTRCTSIKFSYLSVSRGGQSRL